MSNTKEVTLMSPIVFNPPNDEDAKIWRYIDFQQLYHLLNFNTLSFSSPSLFDDTLEGVLPEIIKDEICGYIKTGDRNKIETQFNNLFFFNEKSDINKFFKERIFISCWHQSDYETMAMWKLYGGINKGIAICSTFKKLINVLNDNFYIGGIVYVDSKSASDDARNFIKKFFFKRKPYKSENEIRAIYFHPHDKPTLELDIFDHPIQPQHLIDEIVISPLANEAFVSSVSKLIPPEIKWNRSSISLEDPRKMNTLHNNFFEIIKKYANIQCVKCQGKGFLKNDYFLFCPECINAVNWEQFKSDLISKLDSPHD
jgi:hypothetical protein